ncbi:hypothetical protein ASG50_18240 [Rhizobium sp. Leaf386]|nr:hypothetical protein ASG50_18240 [Rhizobium sp. Leaf386]
MKATDRILEKALDEIINQRETPLVVVLDRLTTRAAALSCIAYGKHHTARQFRACAQTIEEGAFDHVTGEGTVN